MDAPDTTYLRTDQKELLASHPDWEVSIYDEPSLSCTVVKIRVDGITYHGDGFPDSHAFDNAVENLRGAK